MSHPPDPHRRRNIRCPGCGCWARLTPTQEREILAGQHLNPPQPCPHDRRQ